MQKIKKNIAHKSESRRSFIKKISILATIPTLPFVSNSCTFISDEKRLFLNASQYSLLQKIHNVLFPVDNMGPSYTELKTVAYLDWVLSDKNMMKDDRDYITNGIKWVEESSEEELNKKFDALNDLEIEKLVSIIAKTHWGESWLSINLTYIFEAQFSDELYGSNIKGIGWKWLNHYPGYPRPTKELIYDNVFETISNRKY